MKPHTSNRLTPQMNVTRFRWMFPILILLLCLEPQSVSAQQADTAPIPSLAPLPTEEVVRNLVRMNSVRAQALRAYHGTRIYRVNYHGFPGARSAEMVVEVEYEAPVTKEFIVQSVTGSKLVIDKVFKKLMQSEREALDAEVQKRTALNSENYEFSLVGYENTPSGFMYVLTVEPRTKYKFLYRGQVWVDADDFAVVRLKATPARNPSFWTTHTEIEHVYKKVSGFWLPAHNHSVTAIRLGGQAELTIDYNDYQITKVDPEEKLSMLEPNRSTEASPPHK